MKLHTLLALGPVVLGIACSDYEFNAAKDDAEDGDDTADPGVDDPGDSGLDIPDGEGAVKGRVCDLTGEGYVIGATVYVDLDHNGDGESDERIETETDADGYFTLSPLPLGSHTIHVQKGSFSTTIDVTLNTEGLTELAEEECLSDEDVNIAVITGDYDSIQHILDDMGLEYDTYRGTTGQQQYLQFLKDPGAMAEYDIIFFNCGTDSGWLWFDETEVSTNIRDYVQSGGSIYTSDWAYWFFEKSLPQAVDFYGDDAWYGSAQMGDQGTINADVLDPNMQAVLGSTTADLTYDLGAWVVPESVASTTEVQVQGTARLYLGGKVNNAPLMMTVENNGTALYTSFHNEAQITVDMTKILEEVILSL